MSTDLSQEQLHGDALYTGEIRTDDEVVLRWVRGLTIEGWAGVRCTVLGFTPGGSLVISVPSYPELVRVPPTAVSECWRNHIRQVSAGTSRTVPGR